MYCRLLLIYTRCDLLWWMEDRETARMRKYGESKTTRIMMATVPHVTSGSGLRKFQADGFLFDRVYQFESVQGIHFRWQSPDFLWSSYNRQAMALWELCFTVINSVKSVSTYNSIGIYKYWMELRNSGLLVLELFFCDTLTLRLSD